MLPIALVFTDVVGSSAAKRALELGADASARDHAYLQGIQTRHLRLVRECVAAHHGTEIMTIGDAFFLTFEDARDALLCAAEIQIHLKAQAVMTSSGPLRLRIGIHVGTPEYFENSWHGTDVDTAARVEAAGRGEQILLSAAAREAVGTVAGIVLRPLGTFALKGVGNVSLWDADYDKNGVRIPSTLSLETLAHERRVKSVFRAGYIVLAVLVVAAGYFGYQRQHRPVIGEKEPIILADFANKTGESVFDSTLTPAITIQLQQSPILNLVSHQHLRQSMKYLGKPADDPITPDLARQIGQREGIKAYLSGEVDKLGSSYVVTLNAQSTATGDTLAAEQAQASDKDHVLEAAGKAATQMRSRLGESLASIKKLDVPFGQATTPSLEAFQAYALGDADHTKGLDDPEALGHYHQAVDLDPNFAMAWAKLGTVYYNAAQHAKANEDLKRAFTLSGNVSERERLYIQSLYYKDVTGNLQKTRDTLELAQKTYPLDYVNAVNLAGILSVVGDFEGAADLTRKALALEPRNAVAAINLLVNLLYMDQFQESEKILADMHQRQLAGGTKALVIAYSLKYLEGDSASLAGMRAKADGRPDQYLLTGALAQIDEFEGRYRAASKEWQEAAREAQAQQSPDAAGGYLSSAAFGQAMSGSCDNVPKSIHEALSLDNSNGTLMNVLWAASLCNDKSIVLPLLQKFGSEHPEDTLVQQVSIPQARAALALADHQPALAAQLLEGFLPTFDNISLSAYLRGLAHLELRDAPSAIADFQSAARWKGNGIDAGNYGQSLLGLARSYTLNNDKPNARKTYQSLLALWKNADPDLPQLVAAKKEYAALQ
jgi:class 3 adenylate cyclase/tetratricopeptide (TPR) repeat protein